MREKFTVPLSVAIPPLLKISIVNLGDVPAAGAVKTPVSKVISIEAVLPTVVE